MKHLILCREYPPAPSGGIGTYAFHLAHLLAEAGETVHVIGQMWEHANRSIEELYNGRLIIHRLPFEDWASWLPHQPHPLLSGGVERGLFKSNFAPQCFSWQASLLAEKLVETAGIEVIEAQDYEAPLYYFQLRRALGKGPKRRPPCFVHLHSPTEFIARHNDWDLSLPHISVSKRLEDYSICAADALLCPSRYLARQAEAHYGLGRGSIPVIPLPIGHNAFLEREEAIWESGTICYVGRLERRKGVIEWIEAAVEVAPHYPAARFEFIGLNVLGTATVSGEDYLKRLIPNHLRKRFLFRGEQKRSAIPALMALARMAVVPSRWENFPNTCVEAMCSGLPVIATRNGGMAEMIEDGRTGWLANEANATSLAGTLKRALDTPAPSIAEMGRQAAIEIRRMCENNSIVEMHMDFRKRLVMAGSDRSLRLPLSLPRLPGDASTRRKAYKPDATGLAVVIVCRQNGVCLEDCILSLEQQTRQLAGVVIVHNGMVEGRAALSLARRPGWQIIHHTNMEGATAKNAGIEALASSGVDPLGYVFLDESDRLEPNFIAESESTFQNCEEVGVVSCWTSKPGSKDRGEIVVSPCPAFPYQWAVNEAVPFSAIRASTLKEAGNFRIFLQDGYEHWDLVNAAMAAGWVAVTIPAVLGEYKHRTVARSCWSFDHVPGKMRKDILTRYPDLIAQDAADIVLFAESQAWRGNTDNFRDQIAAAHTALRNPRHTILLVLNKLKKTAYHKTTRMLGLFNP